jgi:membrane fusion protein
MPRPPLFRTEAIEHQQQGRQWGDVVFLQPLSVKLLFWGAMAATTLIVTFLLIAQYARKETVPGYLAPTAGVIKVNAPRAGTITEVHVGEGEVIQQDQPLLTIAVDQTTADGDNVDAVVLAALHRQKELLAERIAIEKRREAEERDRILAKFAGLERQIVHLEAQLAAQKQRVALLANVNSAEARLAAKGFLAKNEHARRREALFAQEQNLGALEEELASRQTALDQERQTLAQLPTQTAEKIQELRTRLLDVEQEIAEADGRRAYVVRAPTAGRVSTLQAFVGRTVDPQQLQLSVLPVDSELQAQLLVPTRAIGFVRPGQTVRILYDAFPYQRFGAHDGRVLKVTRTILTETDGAAPFELREPAYKVTVGLDSQEVDAYGAAVPLQADMLLSADIILDRRSLMTWLLDPLLSARRRL